MSTRIPRSGSRARGMFRNHGSRTLMFSLNSKPWALSVDPSGFRFYPSQETGPTVTQHHSHLWFRWSFKLFSLLNFGRDVDSSSGFYFRLIVLSPDANSQSYQTRNIPQTIIRIPIRFRAYSLVRDTWKRWSQLNT